MKEKEVLKEVERIADSISELLDVQDVDIGIALSSILLVLHSTVFMLLEQTYQNGEDVQEMHSRIKELIKDAEKHADRALLIAQEDKMH